MKLRCWIWKFGSRKASHDCTRSSAVMIRAIANCSVLWEWPACLETFKKLIVWWPPSARCQSFLVVMCELIKSTDCIRVSYSIHKMRNAIRLIPRSWYFVLAAQWASSVMDVNTWNKQAVTWLRLSLSCWNYMWCFCFKRSGTLLFISPDILGAWDQKQIFNSS